VCDPVTQNNVALNSIPILVEPLSADLASDVWDRKQMQVYAAKLKTVDILTGLKPR